MVCMDFWEKMVREKTTLMRLICGVLQPTGGSIYCDNIEIVSMGAEYRKLLGYLPQDFGYYGDFTAERFLRYMAALKALPEDYANSRIDELLDMVELKKCEKEETQDLFRRHDTKDRNCTSTFE